MCFVAVKGVAGTIDPGGVVLVIGAFTVGLRERWDRFRARSWRSTSTPRSSTTTSRFCDRAAGARCRPIRTQPAAGRPIDGIEFDDVTFSYPGGTEPAVAGSEPAHPQRRTDRAGRRERRREEHARQAAAALLRSGSRVGARGGRRSEGSGSRGAAQPDRRAVSGLRELRTVGPRERRDGPAGCRGRRRAGDGSACATPAASGW